MIVGQRGPAEAAAHVEQAHQADEARRCDRGDMAGEHLLAHRGGLAENADARGGVAEQHDPDQPELRRLHRLIDEHVVFGHQLGGGGRRHVAFRLPARRRHAHDQRADHHEHEIHAAEHDEGIEHADIGCRRKQAHQPDRQRRSDQGAAAETHDRHPGGHARPIRKPFHQGRDRRDVADAERAAADHAIAEIDDPEIVQVDAERGDQERAGPADAGGEHRLARTALLDPAPEHRRRQPEKHHRQREYPAEIGELPVAGRRLRHPEQPGHRQIEHAERIGLADAQMHAQAPPAAPSSGCSRAWQRCARDRETEATIVKGSRMLSSVVVINFLQRHRLGCAVFPAARCDVCSIQATRAGIILTND